MPAATASHDRGSSADPDDLDNLLDYDEAVQDFWKDMPEANGDNANESNNAPEKDMDEEVKVAKSLVVDADALRSRDVSETRCTSLGTSFANTEAYPKGIAREILPIV